jgi:hypothetical protein
MASLPPRDPVPAKTPSPNRRKAIRLSTRQGISCTIIEGVETTGTAARILDVSQTGVRLIVPTRHETGTYLNAIMTNAAELFSYSSVVIVRYVVSSSDGAFITGCEFLQPLTYDELRALLV